MGQDFQVTAFSDFVDRLPLVDHHVHGAWSADGDQDRFGNALNEADTAPLIDPTTSYDSQLGFAIRRWCAEPLDLPVHVPMADYWTRRTELGEAEVTSRFLSAAGVSDWLIDTGFRSADLLDPAAMAQVSGARTREILRLEVLAESVITTISDPRDYPDAFADALERAAETVVGVKTVIAYRTGFDVDLTRPSTAEVVQAARRWSDSIRDGRARLIDPTVIAYGIHQALQRRLPVQFHVGFGDRDLDLARVNPLLLANFLATPEAARAPILLLHCYPYEREAGYLAQAFAQVHLDVGLASHFLGARSVDLVARSLELAPFHKVLYSSDACGPAELHYFGARLWRNAISRVIGGWVEAGDWSVQDGHRVSELVAAGNARRVYGLSSPTSAA